MNVFHLATDLRPGGRKVCVAIGVFDGVHLGHQQVIRQTLADARQQDGLAVMITFDKHPSAVVAPGRVPPQIYSLPQKLRVIGSLGADALWLIAFDEAFSRLTGEEFVLGVVRDFGNLHSVCVGSEFTFGHRRSGDVALLRKLGGELGFGVHGLSAVALDGQVVSSTRIREAIRTGQLDAAGQMLGRGYSIEGEVVKGDQLGRKLGFPTANLAAHGMALPPNGVYAVRARLGDLMHRAVLNIGLRPTVDGSAVSPRVEAHLMDFQGDLYGQRIEMTFVTKLREEQKFSTVAALTEQIGKDVVAAAVLLGSPSSGPGTGRA